LREIEASAAQDERRRHDLAASARRGQSPCAASLCQSQRSSRLLKK
jgi:hypothetical protein